MAQQQTQISNKSDKTISNIIPHAKNGTINAVTSTCEKRYTVKRTVIKRCTLLKTVHM